MLVALLVGCSGSGNAPPSADMLSASVDWWPSVAPADRWFPVAALLLPTGEVVVADTDQNRLFRMTGREDAPTRLPSPGQDAVAWTALSAAPGLAFYALDGPGQRIQQYDLHGNYLGLALDLERLAEDQRLGPVEPAGLAVDRSGHALVTDRLGDRLLVFGPGWSFLGVWGQSGADPGSWRRPGAVAVGARGPFLVADEGNQRVVLLDTLGDVLAVRDLNEAPRGVAVLSPERFAVSFGRVIEVMNGSLATVETHMLPGLGSCDGGSFVTSALAGSGDLLFVGEGCTGRLLQVRNPGG